MDIYHYDPVTKVYTGTGTADIDPLATKQAGEDRYLVPAHATIDPPPAVGEHEVARRGVGVWQVVPDYRGETVCELDAEGYFVGTVELAVGEDLTPLMVLVPEPAGIESPRWDGNAWQDGRTLEDLQAAKKTEIDTAYAQAIAALPLDPPKERETYAPQYLEAVQWQRDNSFPTPMIDGLLSERQQPGEDKAALCQKIIDAAALYGSLAGPLTGKRQRLIKELAAATTEAEVAAIVW